MTADSKINKLLPGPVLLHYRDCNKGFYFLLSKIMYEKHQTRKTGIHILHLILSPLSTLGIISSLAIFKRIFSLGLPKKKKFPAAAMVSYRLQCHGSKGIPSSKIKVTQVTVQFCYLYVEQGSLTPDLIQL